METTLTLVNKNNRDKEETTLLLPTTDEKIFSILDKLADGDKYDDIIVTAYKSKLDIDFTIYSGDDLYDVNSNIEKLNQCATDDEMIALSEIYNDLNEMLLKAQRGKYYFYPNKTLDDLAHTLLNDEPYGYFKTLYNERNEISKIDELCRQGYQETSTGVILMLER